MNAAQSEEKSPLLAACLSFVVAGLGQVYNGQTRKGIVLFLTFWLILPWLFGIVDAYQTAVKIRQGKISVTTPTSREIAVTGAIFVGVFFFILLGLFLFFFHSLRQIPMG